MKASYTQLILLIPFVGFGQLTYVPDDYFENFLENNNLGNGIENDNYVSTSLISLVEELDIYVNQNFSNGISDLSGIEDFTSLKILDLGYHSLSYVDLSNNNLLEVISIPYNGLDSIKLTNLNNLTTLYLQYNYLENIDISECPNIEVLNLNKNSLTSINLEYNNLINYLSISNNQIQEIDLSNLSLDALNLAQNNLSFLEINNHNFYSSSGSSGDNWLLLDGNQFETLIFSNNEQLEVLNFYDFYFIGDDDFDKSHIKNLIVFDNPILNEINSTNSGLENINIYGNPILEEISIENNLIQCLDITNCINLEVLNCSSNLLNELNTKNGNWNNMQINALSNNLMCVEVENIGFASNNWQFDSFTSFNINCDYTEECGVSLSIIETTNFNKNIKKITNLLGQEIMPQSSQLFIEIYDDGSVEKKIIIE